MHPKKKAMIGLKMLICFLLYYNIHPIIIIIIHALAISLGQKWQTTKVDQKKKYIRAFNEMRTPCTRGPVFFFLLGGRVGGGAECKTFVVLIVFSQSFHCVLIKFPLGSQYVSKFPMCSSTCSQLLLEP
jgi:hypothetical protein